MNDSILCVKKAFEKLEEGKSFKVQKNFRQKAFPLKTSRKTRQSFLVDMTQVSLDIVVYKVTFIV